MKLEILGNGNEIGRSAFLLSDDGSKILLDYGVKLHPEPPQYPMLPKKLDAVLLSHAHLDHSGAMPLLYKRGRPAAFMNDVTLDLINMLLEDSIKIGKKEGYGTPFGPEEVKRMNKVARLVNYKEHFKIGRMRCSLHDAGHIPGSSTILVENGKRVFYTGDIQTRNSNLLDGCWLPKKVDTLILESTYGDRIRKDREEEERMFLESVEEAIAQEEHVLIPVFAVGRAQEILLLLEKYANKIALDGMAKKASDIIAQYGRYVKDKKKLREVLRKVHWVQTRSERKKALKKNPIAVSSAGMLGGGPAVHYLREIRNKPESKVLFTGFLVEDSPGWKLLHTKIFDNSEDKFNVRCDLEQFELSAHADRNGLMSIVQRTNPEQVICIHGDDCKGFAKSIEKELNITAIAPRNGDVIKI